MCKHNNLAYVLFKILWLDNFVHVQYFKKLGLEEDSVIAQEVRILYTYYLPEDPKYLELKAKMDNYNELNK